jgi:alpha-beta hydrolase superfamily lysophospholipase
VVDKAKELAPTLPLFAGGKSMGGRMTSTATSEHPLEGVKGLVFFGFPLHPPNRPGTKRADHLSRVTVPMMFLQGTRDAFADLQLLRPICAQLGSRATCSKHPERATRKFFTVSRAASRRGRVRFFERAFHRESSLPPNLLTEDW